MNKIDYLIEYLKLCENRPSEYSEKFEVEYKTDLYKAMKSLGLTAPLGDKSDRNGGEFDSDTSR